MTAINFLEDTISFMAKYNKTEHDVMFVKTKDNQCSFYQFKKLVKNFNYINKFGCHKVNIDLVVVGRGWWLERKEYDGMEHWVYKEIPLPIKNTNTLDFKCDMCDYN